MECQSDVTCRLVESVIEDSHLGQLEKTCEIVEESLGGNYRVPVHRATHCGIGLEMRLTRSPNADHWTGSAELIRFFLRMLLL